MPIGTKNKAIKGCGLHHIAVQARDWDASLRLYQDVLGMEIVSEIGSPERKIALLDMGDGGHIELFAPKAGADLPESDAPGFPVVHIALTTTDTHAAAERVREAGYEITVEPRDVSLSDFDVTLAFFKGPNGEVIEFFQVH